jgi:hypothetical protein
MSVGIDTPSCHVDRNHTTISGNQVRCGSPDGMFEISSPIVHFRLSAFVIVVALQAPSSKLLANQNREITVEISLVHVFPVSTESSDHGRQR